jgi:hypothetical protein
MQTDLQALREKPRKPRRDTKEYNLEGHGEHGGEWRQNYRIGRTGLVYRHGVGSRRQPLQRELNPA